MSQKIKTYKEQIATSYIHQYAQFVSQSLLAAIILCAFLYLKQDIIRKTWACYFNDSISLYTILGLYEAPRQICKYSEILWRLCVELWVETLCVIGGQYVAFYTSEMKYSAKANLR